MVPFIQQFIAGYKTHYPNTNLLICTLYNKNQNNYFWNDIEVIPLNFNGETIVKKSFLYLPAVLKVRKLILQNKSDGILSFWYSETALIANIVSLLTSIKHFTWLQGQDVKKSNKFMRFFRPNPDNLIALSPFQNNYLYKDFGFYAKTVNAISVNPSFCPKINIDNRTIDIIGIGSFIALKNFHLFLKVIASLKKTNPNINVALIGNGPLEKQLKEYCLKNNLENNIKFLGLLSHKETLTYMNNAKILLHTSEFEGGSAVVHEALFLGCQVIAKILLVEQEKFPFYLCKSLDEMTKKAIIILNEQQQVKQQVPHPLKLSTQKIHNLFFN